MCLQMVDHTLAIIVGGVIGGILLIVIAVELYIIYELLRARKFKQKLMAEMESMDNKRKSARLVFIIVGLM